MNSPLKVEKSIVLFNLLESKERYTGYVPKLLPKSIRQVSFLHLYILGLL